MLHKKINILHVIDVSDTGGAETVFVQLINNINREKYNHIVLIPDTGWIHDQLVKIDIKPIIVNMRGSFSCKYLLELVKIVRKNNISLIHSHLFGSNVYCSIVALITNTPVISTFHGSIDIADNEKFLRLKSFLIRIGSSKIIFVSNYLKKKLVDKLSLKDDQCQVIYNGVNTKYFSLQGKQDYRTKFNIGKDEIFVALVGNVNFAKGYDVLIEAVNQLKDNNFKFIIAGDCSDHNYEKLSQRIIDLKLTNSVIFAGFVDNIRNFIQSADIYLLCSRDEGFSISTIEAMACGIPVVVTKSGGPEEIVENNVSGLLVENENSDALAVALITTQEENALRTRLASAGRKHVRDTFGIEKTIDDYLQLYNKLILLNN